MNPQNEEAMFEVRIENVSTAFDFTSTGIFNTPAGSDRPGPLLPGNSYEFTFSGGPVPSSRSQQCSFSRTTSSMLQVGRESHSLIRPARQCQGT